MEGQSYANSKAHALLYSKVLPSRMHEEDIFAQEGVLQYRCQGMQFCSWQMLVRSFRSRGLSDYEEAFRALSSPKKPFEPLFKKERTRTRQE